MRILLVQPSITPPGGGNLVAAWMLEALRGAHRTTLLAWEAPNLAACNRFFGTSLRPGDFDLRLAPEAARRLGALTPIPLAFLKHGVLLRQARRLAQGYDLLVTADNEADFGRRGIQYIHYPKLDPERPAVDLRWYHEFEVKNRLEGDSVFLTVSVPLAITQKPQQDWTQAEGKATALP